MSETLLCIMILQKEPHVDKIGSVSLGFSLSSLVIFDKHLDSVVSSF